MLATGVSVVLSISSKVQQAVLFCLVKSIVSVMNSFKCQLDVSEYIHILHATDLFSVTAGLTAWQIPLTLR